MRTFALKFFVLCLVLFGCTAFASAQSKLVGDWTGTLNAGGSTYHVALHVAADANGKLASSFDNIDQNIYGIKAKSITLNEAEITAEVDDVVQVNGQDIPIKGIFKAKANSDWTEITGTWQQEGPDQSPADVVLKRSASLQPSN